ncbi:hypothetical protein QBC47DRAFT_406383 [Echria macrotheca]|uniref:Xylanolytic transcriptional activator regulatory domain-containing protein n=1 Tax=Echria macrotheca TaxID=438768 RepID=A0AAJ0B3Q5_9PEZI|nr:hypothetical protein QBC47DRAFT_406383 [Echria macrotheca]
MIARQRKRRFPEKELLNRIRNYEALLVENNIAFEPLHGPPRHPADRQSGRQSASSTSSPSSTQVKSEEVYEPKNFWLAMNHAVGDDDSDSDSSEGDQRITFLKQKFKQNFPDHEQQLLLTLSEETHMDLSSFHPDPIQILRLWQTYLESVDPLFKVTHSITLQARIIEAAANINNIPSALEALMLSIYCVTIATLNPDDCQAAFGSPKEDLFSRFRLGCQHALTKADYLRSRDRECLTAFFFYLVSMYRIAHPQSISSLCGVAMRTAQRMGINNESSLARFTPFEAEMRRRLWWALVIFDRRVAEVSGCMTVTQLVPTWDCKIPLNVNDSELRPEMSEPPPPSRGATEAVFAVVRAEFGDFIRHAPFQLDYTCPWLKPLARDSTPHLDADGFIMPALEKSLEQNYLRHCDPNNALHFMTIWMTRAQLSTALLIEYFSKHHDPNAPRLTETERSATFSHALRTLVCGTRILASPHAKKLRWLARLYFPFPHYFHIFQELKRRPLGDHADRAWEVMERHYDAIFEAFTMSAYERPNFRVFARLILMGWEEREAAEVAACPGKVPVPPRIVTHIRGQLEQLEREEQMGQGRMCGSETAAVVDASYLAFGIPATPPTSQGLMNGGGLLQESLQMPWAVDLTQLDWNGDDAVAMGFFTELGSTVR